MKRTALIKTESFYTVEVDRTNTDTLETLEDKAYQVYYEGKASKLESSVMDLQWLSHDDAEYMRSKSQEKPITELPSVNFTIERLK